MSLEFQYIGKKKVLKLASSDSQFIQILLKSQRDAIEPQSYVMRWLHFHFAPLCAYIRKSERA
jgi:hypothetical protein